MKKVSLCIGIIFAIFLLVGIYEAQAQPAWKTYYDGLNGKWFKVTSTVKGLGYSNGYYSSNPGGTFSDKYMLYMCAKYDTAASEPANYVDVDLYKNVNGEAKQVGVGFMYYEAGSVNDWMAFFELYIAGGSLGDYEAGTNIYIEPSGQFKNDGGYGKGSFTAFSLYGDGQGVNATDDWVEFGGKFKASLTTKLPFDTVPACTGIPTP